MIASLLEDAMMISLTQTRQTPKEPSLR